MNGTRARVAALALALAACTRPAAPPPPAPADASQPVLAPALDQVARSSAGMVVAGSPYATAVGAGVLAEGGNAVDAAVATAFALAVVEPSMSGLGGRTQMLIRTRTGDLAGYDGTTEVPARYPAGEIRNDDAYGYRTIGIPGTVAALTRALETHGTWPVDRVVAPAIALAERGFVLTPEEAGRIAAAAGQLREFEGGHHFLQPDGQPYAPGDVFRQPALARVLRAIAANGRAGFYDGWVADRIAEDMRASGGYVERADLAAYHATDALVVRGAYRGRAMAGTYLPASGATTIEILQIMDHFPLAGMAGTAEWAAITARALLLGFEDRTRSFPTPEEHARWLVSEERSAARALDIELPGTPPDGGAGRPESDYTTHLSAVDAGGMAVALTQSLGPSMGSRVVAPGLGFVYAATMGYLGDLQPGERPWSSQSPLMILDDDGRPQYVLGAAGGRRIISAIVETVSRALDQGLELPDAMAAPRFHVTTGTLTMERREATAWPDAALAELRGYGFNVETSGEAPFFARIHGIARQGGQWVGVADPRWQGAASGPELETAHGTAGAGAVDAAQGTEPAPIQAGLPPTSLPYAPGFDALHYDIRLDVTGAPRVRARTTLDVARVAPRRDTLRLDLTGLLVTEVRLGTAGADAAVPFVQRDGRLLVSVAGERGDTLRVTVVYEGVPDDGLVVRGGARGPASVFADNWPNRARFWFPSIDHPSDKATVAFAIRAPDGWEVVANGRRVDASGRPLEGAVAAADGIWHWRLDVPVPTYVMVFGAMDFAVTDLDACAAGGVTALRPDGCLPLSVWSLPADSGTAARRFARAGDMAAFFAATVGPYPYAKLAHVQSSTRFGGMENAGAIFYSQRSVAADRDIDGLIAHETAHQWFGDGVTEARWADVWLSEGFASYFTDLWFEHDRGVSALRDQLREARQDVLRSGDAGRPMVDTLHAPASLYDLLNAISYQKGEWVLHMLRREVGDSAFFDGMRRYYGAHANGTATTADLRAAVEAAAGRDLGWFFHQWVDRPGYPVLRLEHAWNDRAGAAVLTVEQVQSADWPTFRIPVTVELTTPQGVVRRTLQVAERRTEVRIPLPAPPTAVVVDPDVDLLYDVAEPH